jgi:hypothetical protein
MGWESQNLYDRKAEWIPLAAIRRGIPHEVAGIREFNGNLALANRRTPCIFMP